MKLTLITKLSGGIKIFCNRLNWVLDYGDKNNRFYYASLDELLEDLLEIRLKIAASKARKTKTNIRHLIKAVQDLRVSVRKDIEAVLNAVTKADRARRKGKFNG